MKISVVHMNISTYNSFEVTACPVQKELVSRHLIFNWMTTDDKCQELCL